MINQARTQNDYEHGDADCIIHPLSGTIGNEIFGQLGMSAVYNIPQPGLPLGFLLSC
jgi:hypothetical protein